MRARLVLPLATIALLALVAPACSSDDSSDQAAKTSPARPTTTTEKPRSSGDDDSSSGDDDSGSGESTLPDPSDDLGLDQLGDCLDLATAYGSLYLDALGGADGAKDALETAEELKAQLPEELHDEIDVIAEAIGEVADKGLLDGGEALSTPEYQAADKAIVDYLTEACGVDSGSDTGGA